MIRSFRNRNLSTRHLFMKRICFQIFIILLAILPLQSCGGGGAGGGLGDSSSTGSDSDGEESGVSLETGGPADLPVPIAKIDGVDPTSVRFEETDEGDVVGTLFASTVGRVEGNVGMIKEGNFADRRDTSGGNVEFDISESLLDITLALVVVGTGENEGSVSPPVLVRISKSKKLHVAITNLGNVQTTRLTLSEDDLVAFSGQSSWAPCRSVGERPPFSPRNPPRPC